MDCYRRTKIALEVFHKLYSTIVRKAPVQVQSRMYQNRLAAKFSSYSCIFSQHKAPNLKSASRIYQNWFANTDTVKFSSYSPISNRLTFRVGINYKNQHCNPVFNTLKRYYSQGPKRGNYKSYFQTYRKRLIVGACIIGSIPIYKFYVYNLESIPYSKRNHFVPVPNVIEKLIGEIEIKKQKEEELKGKILDARHPDSVRVKLISKEIIEGMQRELGLKSDLIALQKQLGLTTNDVRREEYSRSHTSTEDGEGRIFHDMPSQQKGRKEGLQAATSHLEGLRWEVLVVDEPSINAWCLPGGKIVVYTELLKQFTSNAEIASIIGHEVGHVVARHSVEKMTLLSLLILSLYIGVFYVASWLEIMVDADSAKWIIIILSRFLSLPFSRRQEMEADYIGMMLFASAGYDPRLAPPVYEKFDEVSGRSKIKTQLVLSLLDFFSTHPSGKERAQALIQSQAMEEALNIYRKVRTKQL